MESVEDLSADHVAIEESCRLGIRALVQHQLGQFSVLLEVSELIHRSTDEAKMIDPDTRRRLTDKIFGVVEKEWLEIPVQYLLTPKHRFIKRRRLLRAAGAVKRELARQGEEERPGPLLWPNEGNSAE